MPNVISILLVCLTLIGHCSTVMGQTTAKRKTKVWAEEPTSFFKIEFGRPLSASVPDCPQHQASDRLSDEDFRLFCVDRSAGFAAIRYVPMFFFVHVAEVEGAAEEVFASFRDEDRDTVAAALVAKFGRPTVDRLEDWQGRSGISLKNHVLIWIGKDVQIRYESIGSHVDEGFLFASTAKYRRTLTGEAVDSTKRTADSF